MATAALVVHVEPADEASEAEFNRWYDEVHIPQMVARIPGVVGGSRYRLASELLAPEDNPVHGYLTIYELDTDDLEATAQRIAQAVGDGTLEMSESLAGGDRTLVLRYYHAL